MKAIAILRPLSPEQCAQALEAIKDELPKIISKKRQFYYLLDRLDNANPVPLIMAMKDMLPNFIEDNSDLLAVLSPLSVEQRD